ncbi:trypco2 family protein [Nitrosopumilus sp.]|uniref:trypco2 family protein n=1 Tax=Nitrosopumilus sp. TaxID=2024843 RepID=UPI003B5C2E5A
MGLVSLIEALKEELRQLDENPETPHFFQIDGAEIEVNVTVNAEAHGGVFLGRSTGREGFQRENSQNQSEVKYS